jgi:hypothetical protein
VRERARGLHLECWTPRFGSRHLGPVPKPYGERAARQRSRKFVAEQRSPSEHWTSESCAPSLARDAAGPASPVGAMLLLTGGDGLRLRSARRPLGAF